jgi:hypothetical protein
MMKKLYKLFCFLFFAILVACGIATFGLEDMEFSENENRYLQKKPEFSTTSLKDGSFQKELETYLSDQFPFRNFSLEFACELKKVVGKTDINGVYLGKDGYYLQKISDADIDIENYKKNLERIELFLKNYKQINTSVLFVPTPETILEEKLPKYAKMYDSELLYKMAKELLTDAVFVDVREVLKENSDSYIYYRTDHHWTSYGAYLAYQRFCIENQMDYKSLEDCKFRVFSDDFLGTMYSKVLDKQAKPDCVEIADNIGKLEVSNEKGRISLYDENAALQKDKYQVFFGGNTGLITINSDNKNGKKLLVIKDSFANSFIPLLANQYETVLLIDPRYYPNSIETLMEDNSITDALFLYEIYNFSSDTSLLKLLPR